MTTWLFDPGVSGAGPDDVLHITMRFEGDVTVCSLEGPLCALTAPSLDDWLAHLASNDRHRIIVDGSRVASLSGDGVDVLVDHAGRAEAAGGRLRVRAPSTAARRGLDRCDAGHLLEPSA